MKRTAAIRTMGCLAASCLVAAGLSGRQAHASCGDYVMIGGHAADGDHGMAGAAHSSGRALLPEHGEHESPCHGPHCSQRSSPSPQQPVTLTSGQQHWGLMTDATEMLLVELVKAAALESSPTTVRRSEPIFRPPRHG
ncbi:MAG TPA: hypothetical protein VFI31_19895 [Pirellulales bacterium]|nr:hypothetical protein [Pirellulales bacterium]